MKCHEKSQFGGPKRQRCSCQEFGELSPHLVVAVAHPLENQREHMVKGLVGGWGVWS